MKLVLKPLIQAHLNFGELKFSLDFIINIFMYHVSSQHLQTKTRDEDDWI